MTSALFCQRLSVSGFRNYLKCTDGWICPWTIVISASPEFLSDMKIVGGFSMDVEEFIAA